MASPQHLAGCTAAGQRPGRAVSRAAYVKVAGLLNAERGGSHRQSRCPHFLVGFPLHHLRQMVRRTLLLLAMREVDCPIFGLCDRIHQCLRSRIYWCRRRCRLLMSMRVARHRWSPLARAASFPIGERGLRKHRHLGCQVVTSYPHRPLPRAKRHARPLLWCQTQGQKAASPLGQFRLSTHRWADGRQHHCSVASPCP